MYLKILETYVLKYTNFILQKSLSAPEVALTALKNTKVKLDRSTEGKISIRGRICHSIYWYAKANSKYMKDFDKNKELSYIQYWYVNNLYGLVMLQKISTK